VARKFVGDLYEATKTAKDQGRIAWFEGSTYSDQIELNPWRDRRGQIKNRCCAKKAQDFDKGWNEAMEES